MAKTRIEIGESLDSLGGEKKEEVAAVVCEWIDSVDITFPDRLAKRIEITALDVHAIVDGVEVGFQLKVSE